MSFQIVCACATAVAKPPAAAVNCDDFERVLWTIQRGIIRKKQGETRVRMQSVSTMFLTELYKLHMCFMDEYDHPKLGGLFLHLRFAFIIPISYNNPIIFLIGDDFND